MKNINLIHGNINLPAFFPDGTYGVIKSLDSNDLLGCGINGIVMNAFHLHSKPGLSIIKKHGGINKFIGWNNPILTDSGGFQVFSLLRENKMNGQIRANEIIFRPNQGKGKIIFTPQKSIQLQFAVMSDIIMCLDYCTHPDDSYDIQKKAVETTIRWAKMCKDEYEIQYKNYKYTPENRPLLFGIIQGGNDESLRKECAEALLEIGFDGFGFGGWPLDSQGNLTYDILKYTADLIPDNYVKYAMGIGKPEEILQCVEMGYNLFDCVIPTREARHHRLYVYTNTGFDYEYLYIMDDKYIADTSPVSDLCDCYCCRNFSKSYLHHLFKINDSLAFRLATIHNLRFYSMLVIKITGKINGHL